MPDVTILPDDERVEGICLSWRAAPLTNVVIELQENDRLRRVLGFAFPCSAQPPTRAANETATDNQGKGT